MQMIYNMVNKNIAANLTEVFCSFQGEGIYIGVPQIFVRLSVCHMRCYYCDSQNTWSKNNSARFEASPFSNNFNSSTNPVSLAIIDTLIENYCGRSDLKFHSVSITGGEPLLQHEFVNELCMLVHEKFSLLTYLETSGTLPHLLSKVIDEIDIASLDIKPPSCRGVKSSWNEIEECIKISKQTTLFIKIVLTEHSPNDEELLMIGKLHDKYGFNLILTPVSKITDEIDAPTPGRIIRIQGQLEKLGISSSLVPQIHRVAEWL